MNTSCRIVFRNALRSIVLLLVFSCAGRMAAQDRVFRVWDANDGLSQVSVTAITTDAQRRLWVGTADGINLFDGIRFTSYRQSSSDLLNIRSNYVAEDFIEESDSTLLVIYKDGVYRFHLETGALAQVKLEYDPAYGGPNDFFTAGRDQQGNFIFVQSGFVHSVAPGASEAVTLAVFPKSGFMKSLWIGSDELVCHTSGGLAVVNVKTKSQEIIPYPDSARIDVFRLSHEADGIVLCTSQGMLRFNRKTDTFQNALPSFHSPVYDYWIDQSTGQWWLACGLEGIRIVHPQRGQIAHYPMNDPLKGLPTSGFVRLLESDKDGLLWIGIDGGGLAATTVLPSEWKRFASGNPAGLKLPSNFVRSLYWTGDALLLGTLNGGLVSYDPKRDITAPIALGNSNNLSVSQLSSDKEGRIWAATDKGLFISSDRGAQFRRVYGCGQFPIALVHQTMPLASGEVLISSEQGIWLSTPGSDCVELVSSQYVFYWMFQDSKGTLWGSSYYGPLYRFELVRNRSGAEIEITERIADQFNVRNYAEDKNRGVIWMATEKGLLEFRGTMEQSRLWTMSDGLANDFIYSLYLDAHGRVWFSSNKGIGLLEPETGYVRNFSIDDGLQCSEFNTHALAVTSDGLMYWGGTTGFNSVSSSAFLGELRDPLPVLFRLRLDENDLKPALMRSSTSPLRVSSTSRLFFALGTSDYWNAARSQIQYRIPQRDSVWLDSPVGNFISPGELPPGTYTLEARLRKADGSWSAIATMGHFSIPAPLWQRTWFVVLAIVCLLLFAVGIIWLIQRRKWKGKIERMKREEELQQMRLRISRDIHDDIGSGLSRIVLMNQLRQPGEDVFSQRISETARDLTRQLGHIVWSLNPENDQLTSTWYYLRQECGRYFEGTSVQLEFIDHNLPGELILDPSQRANTIRIFREAMNNALKYSEATHISISCSFSEHRVHFRIADNGRGFAPGEIQGNGNGLRNFKKRIEELKGELAVDSTPGNGVVISFSFPVNESTT